MKCVIKDKNSRFEKKRHCEKQIQYIYGIIVGILFGIINCLFLLFAKDLELTVYASTFITWIVIGLFVSSVDFQMKYILKGIVVSFLVSFPSFLYIFSYTLLGGIWTFSTTIMLGAFMGYVLDKINRNK